MALGKFGVLVIMLFCRFFWLQESGNWLVPVKETDNLYGGKWQRFIRVAIVYIISLIWTAFPNVT